MSDSTTGVTSPSRQPLGNTRGLGRVLIAGLGHIGAGLPALVASSGLVRHVRLVDRGRVRQSHVHFEGYPPAAVGRFKSDVVAERCAVSFPDVVIESLPSDLEDVPTGYFDVDVCLGALDSLRARQVLVSERAFPLGVPVVDGGVGESLLGRVHVFHPASACLECRFGPKEYRRLAVEYPCRPDGVYSAPSTVAPAYVGSVVAGIMAAEMAGILSRALPAESCEVYFDLGSRRFLTSRLRRAASCRFDHEVVRNCLGLGMPFEEATLGHVLHLLTDRFGTGSLQLEFRRGIVCDGETFGASRLISPRALESHSSQPLTDLGLTRRDRIRVYGEERARNAFVVMDQFATPSRVLP